eukprot:Tbor_TRINITY_DN1691_c0_g1::TRINITY_DN1691_c0_g1_i1::g.7616::m.7616
MTSKRDIINPAAVYGLELPSRSICAFPSQSSASDALVKDVHRFLVGTFSSTYKADPKECNGGSGTIYHPPNKVHLIEYDESSSLIECTAVWPHPEGPILHISNAGTAKWSECQDLTYNLFSTIYPVHRQSATAGEDAQCPPLGYHTEAALFATVSINGEEKSTKVGSFPTGTSALDWGDVKSTCSSGKERTGTSIELRAIIDGQLCVVTLLRNTPQSYESLLSELQYDVHISTRISLGGQVPELKNSSSSMSAFSPFVLAWDAVNQPSRCAVANGSHILLVDTRMKTIMRILCTSQSKDGAHGMGSVKSLYFPSTKANIILSGGEDGCIIYWDCMEQPRESTSSKNFAEYENNLDKAPYNPSIMLKLCAHHHWIHSIAISPINEELLLTCSSDRCLTLWHLDGLVSAAAKLHKQNTGDETYSVDEKHHYSKMLQTLRACDVPTWHLLDDFGDSVTACTWGCSTPWIFAGVAYNGKILVSKVGDSLRRDLLLGKSS